MKKSLYLILYYSRVAKGGNGCSMVHHPKTGRVIGQVRVEVIEDVSLEGALDSAEPREGETILNSVEAGTL